MSEGIDEPGMVEGPGLEFPRTVRIAGIIWSVIGCLTLLNALVTLLVDLAAAGGGVQVAGGLFGALFGAFVGGVFIHVGRQTILGKAADTLGNGIGSIVFAAINLGTGALVVVGTVALGGGSPVLSAVLGGMSILCGAGLLVPGVLALAGHAQYREWRREQKARHAAGA